MSGNATDPPLGIAGETTVRKRGRPKKVRVDDAFADSKRQKIDAGPGISAEMPRSYNSPGIGIPQEKVENTSLQENRDEVNNGQLQELQQQSLRNLAVMNSKRNAILPGDLKEEPALHSGLDNVETDNSSEAAMRASALEAVLQVHGICIPAQGGAASFPGEAGRQEGAAGGGDKPTLCAICRQPEIKRQTIICDGCERSFHVSCVSIPAERVNDLDDWTCPFCSGASNATGFPNSDSKLGQEYLDRKLERVAVSKIAHKGRGKKPESVQGSPNRVLDLNVPAEAPDEVDHIQGQNGSAEQDFRLKPSQVLPTIKFDFRESQNEAMVVPLPTAAPILGRVHESGSEAERQLWPLESSALKVPGSNGELRGSSSSEKLSDPGERFPSLKIGAGAAVTVGQSPAKIEESGNITGGKGFPEKITTMSVDLGKVCIGNASNRMKELARFSGIRASGTSEPTVGSNASRPIDLTEDVSDVMESKHLALLNSLSESSVSLLKATEKIPQMLHISSETSPKVLLDTLPKFPVVTSEENLDLPDITYYGSKPFTPLHRERTTRPLEKALPTVPSGQVSPPSVAGRSGFSNQFDLTGRNHGEVNGSQQSPGIHYVDLTGVVHDSLHGQKSKAVSEDAGKGSVEDQELISLGDEALQQLKDAIHEKHGLFLADGWEVDVKRRKNERHLDKYFISPEKQRFRSRLEVMRHLGLTEDPRRKSDFQQHQEQDQDQDQPKNWSALVQQAETGKGELQRLFIAGESVIENLGVVDLRPGFRDELHIWPVGYRSTWHDSTTASFCVSEVIDNGSTAPVFRVTRKFCPTLLTPSNETGGAIGPIHRTDIDVVENGSGKQIIGKTKDELNSFLRRPLLSAFQGPIAHYSSASDREDRDSIKALLGGLGGVTDEQHSADEWESSQARDVIGEFTVEGSSPAHAWKLFAEEIVERCRRNPWVLDLSPDLCPHFKLLSQPNASNIPEVNQSSDSKFSALLEKLGQDRFGLSEISVKAMIENLPNADISNTESRIRYNSLEQRGLYLKEDESVAKVPPQSRVRIREKARKHRKVPEALSEEQNGVVEQVESVVKEETIALPPPPVPQRPPPPAGQPLGGRLPPELVGDVLQIWEFLCRFADVIGRAEPPPLEDLEEGLICGAAIAQHHVVRPDSSHGNVDDKGGKVKLESDAVTVLSGDVDVPITEPGISNGDTRESPLAVTDPLPSSEPSRSLSSPKSQQMCKNGVQHKTEEDERTPASGIPEMAPSPADFCPDLSKGAEHLTGDADQTQAPKPLISTGFSTAGSIHIPLMNYLLSDLQSKVCGSDEGPGENDELKPQKRGRKRVRDTVLRPILGREKLSESFSVNEWTWPEIARRYMISVSSLAKIGEIAEDNTEECLKILRCIQGDGGILCGALDGVAGMEVDAQLLAEAEKELANGSRDNEDSQGPNTPAVAAGKDTVDGAKAQGGSEEAPNWVKLLDPIAKLPTNVGSRIRNRVRDALEAGPPEWAVELLEQSISKQVYKGNASGPTKRIVMEVLGKVRGEGPADAKVKKTKKQRKRVVPSPEVVMQRCRIVLRQVAGADKDRIVSTGIGTIITNFYESEGEGLLARPLDFRAIDLRLGAGAYGSSPAAFAADVRQIWKNVSAVYGNDSEEFVAIGVLSELFESLYSKQVVIFQGGVESTAAAAAEGKVSGSSGEAAPQNPVGEQAPGHDAGENVKAPWEDDSCRICGIDDDHDNVLLCDSCDAEYHIYCLNPPLPEVPEGNWYCSSCVAVDKGFLEVASVPEAPTEAKTEEKQDQEPLQKEDENGLEKEPLQSGEPAGDLAWRDLKTKLEVTDYWHLTLADRVCLLRFLCDQALDTLKVRIHVEEAMDVALEHQSKLRQLLAERRRQAEFEEARLDYAKEGKNAFALLHAGAAKLKRPNLEAGNQIAEDISYPPLNVGGIVENDQKGPPGSVQHSPAKGAARNDFTVTGSAAAHSARHELAPLDSHHKGNESGKDVLAQTSDFRAMEIDLTANPGSRNVLEGSEEKPIRILDDSFRPFESLQQEETAGDTLRTSHGSESDVGRVSLSRGLTSPLDAEIAKAIAKLTTVNIRRELFGRDDHGRAYWALSGSRSSPWLAVEVDADRQPEGEDRGLATDMADSGNRGPALSSLSSLDNLGNNEGEGNSRQTQHNECAVGSVAGDWSQKKPEDDSRWFIYSDGEVLDRLIGWFSPSSAQERALKSILLQWRGFLFIQSEEKSEQLEGPSNPSKKPEANTPKPKITRSAKGNTDSVLEDLGESKTRPSVPLLRATKHLEWKYGPFGSSTSKDTGSAAPSKRGRKKKSQKTADLSRCKCLEPVWTSRFHCTTCHVTFESAVELELHSKGNSCANEGDNPVGEEAGKKKGKKGSQAGKGGVSNKAPETPSSDQLSAIIALPPDPSTMPFVVRDTNQDRINRIGLIKDKVPTFAPGLSVAPVFDPSLMVFDSLPDSLSSTSEEGASNSHQQLLNTLAVGGTSCLIQGDAGNSEMASWVLIKSSEDLPGVLDGASEANRFVISQEPLEVPIAGASAIGSLTDKQNTERWNSLEKGALQEVGNLGLPLPGVTKSRGRVIQVTGKLLVISEASLLPLEDKSVRLLEQLKMHLLDIDAVLSSDMLELGRGSWSRRQAWRSLVKSAKSIYRMVQATILLEQMVCADFLRNTWGYWSSFSAAAKTATVSSLFLRVYALDAAILYENSEEYIGQETTVVETKQGKRVNEKEDKKRKRDDGTSPSVKSVSKKKKKDEGTI